MTEKKIHPASAIVLGLNDALVELTGSLAGLSLALASTNLIAVAGIIIGFSGALSMTASEYLSAKEDQNKKKKAHIFATYTGLSYLGTVLILTSPYLIFETVSTALSVMVQGKEHKQSFLLSV
jgi:VIT1/CCC1 family predicted Fe2+/Mn2+ transporter